jgi:uncharacterized protein (TIGR00297 family)
VAGLSLLPPAPWSLAVGLPLGLGASAWGLRMVRRSAFLAGVPVGVFVARTGGIAGFLVLLGFFLLGTVLTRIGYAAKAARGVAEDAGGRRGASHVLANCGAGLLLLLMRVAFGHENSGTAGSALLWAAYVGSFATAASDTSSSEIGKLIGRHPISPRTLRPVAVGTQGAVSLEGTVAGLLAAALMALLGLALGLLSWPGVAAVTMGGFLGNLLESLAGTWGRRVLPHGMLNFTNTAIGAALSAGALAVF